MSLMNESEILQRYESLEQERKPLDGTLSLIERYVMPGRGKFFNSAETEQEMDWSHRDIYDGTQYNAHQMLVANIHGNLTSDAFKWFDLSFEQDELNKDKEAREWLEDCSNLEYKSISQESNFGLEAMEFYTDASGFGTGVMLHDEQEGPPLEFNGHRFGAQMMRQCYFEETFDGKPMALYIKRTYSARQLAIKFGADALPAEIKELLENPDRSGTTDIGLVRVIYLDRENKDANVASLLEPSKRPYVGRYVLSDCRKFVGEEERFYEFPGYILRWARTAGSKYGFCPTMVALGDILTLQEMVMMLRTSTEKTVDPPMKSTRRGLLSELDQEGGGLTFVRDMNDLQPLAPPGSYRVDTGWGDINDIRRRIDRMYYIDQLQLKESPEMTATEVRVRYELMQRLLGPTLGRIKTDFLDPLVKRSFWMMFRKGVFKPMPDSVKQLQGRLKIQYLGPLAKAQRMHEVDAIQRWLGMGASFAQIEGAQQVLDVPDYDAAYKHVGQILGVPEHLVRADAEVKKIRAARAQDQENAKQAAALESAAGSVEKIAKAKSMGADMGMGDEEAA